MWKRNDMSEEKRTFVQTKTIRGNFSTKKQVEWSYSINNALMPAMNSLFFVSLHI